LAAAPLKKWFNNGNSHLRLQFRHISSASTIEADEAMLIRWLFSWSIINNPGTHQLSHWHPYRLLMASEDAASIAASTRGSARVLQHSPHLSLQMWSDAISSCGDVAMTTITA